MRLRRALRIRNGQPGSEAVEEGSLHVFLHTGRPGNDRLGVVALMNEVGGVDRTGPPSATLSVDEYRRVFRNSGADALAKRREARGHALCEVLDEVGQPHDSPLRHSTFHIRAHRVERDNRADSLCVEPVDGIRCLRNAGKGERTLLLEAKILDHLPNPNRGAADDERQPPWNNPIAFRAIHGGCREL